MRDKKTAFLNMSGSLFGIWMVLNTFVTSNVGVNLVLLALSAGFVHFIHIPPVHHGRFGENIMSLLTPKKDNRKKNSILHKGGAGLGPGNTMEAIREAIKSGIPAIEIDVNFTKDNIGVLIHGPRLEDSTDGFGFIHEKTWEELQTLNAAVKSPHKDKYPVARIPTLEECVKECIENDIVIFFDCKANAKQTANLLTSMYQKHPELYCLGIVCSFFPHIIYAVRQKDPNVLTALSHRFYNLETNGDGSARNKELWKRLIVPFLDRFITWLHDQLTWYICGNSFFLLDRGSICGDTKKFWDRLGVHVVAWTVNEQTEKNHLVDDLGVPVITDGLLD